MVRQSNCERIRVQKLTADAANIYAFLAHKWHEWERKEKNLFLCTRRGGRDGDGNDDDDADEDGKKEEIY